MHLHAAGCAGLARRVFAEQLKARGDRLLRYPPAPPRDLSPPKEARIGAPHCVHNRKLCSRNAVVRLTERSLR